MTAVSVARPIALSDIFADWAWNSRTLTASTSADGRTLFEESAREDSESAGLDGLVDDIATAGQHTPVDVRIVPPEGLVYGDGHVVRTGGRAYALVCGFRRLAAVTLLNESLELRTSRSAVGKTVVPNVSDGHILAVVHGTMTEREASILNAEENFNRESLGPVDRCLVVRRLAALKMSSAEIATRLGKRRAAIEDYKRVLEMDPEIFAHWSGAKPKFRDIEIAKRIGIVDLFDIAKKPKDEQAEHYERALQLRASVEATSAWEVRARARAVATGTLLAKLERAGFITMLGREWSTDSSVVMAISGLRDGHGKATGARMTEFAMAAKDAYERERKRLVAAPAVPQNGSIE